MSAPQTYSRDATFDQWLAVLGRAAVPYFFLVSGCLTGLRSDRGAGDKIKSLATRILPAWIFWEAAYLVYDSAIKVSHGISIATDLSVARILTQGGPASHLWFLLSLLVVSTVIILLNNLLPWRYALIFAFCAIVL